MASEQRLQQQLEQGQAEHQAERREAKEQLDALQGEGVGSPVAPSLMMLSGFCCTARQCSCGVVWACATGCLASAGRHAGDLAAADTRRSSERAQHAQQADQQAARHASRVLELQRRLEEAMRYLPLTTEFCTCLKARQMTAGSR